jgi:hypothetical protein
MAGLLGDERVRPLAPLVAFGGAVAALVVVSVLWLPGFIVNRDVGRRASDFSAEELAKAKNDVRTSLLQAIGGLVLVGGAIATWRQLRATQEQLRLGREGQTATLEQLRISREGQITERFTEAIKLLASDKSTSERLGGIYALERIARDSKRDHGPVMEVLTAFVRTADMPEQEGDNERRPSVDVQTAITVIGRRRTEQDVQPLDLRHGHLEGTDLVGAHLEGAYLADAYLEGANLEDAHLQGANLGGAHLKEASLWHAYLEGAFLLAAHLEGAHLGAAHLEGADLAEAHLEGAHLGGAHLEGADLKGAKADDRTRWPTGFDWEKAGVSKEPDP